MACEHRFCNEDRCNVGQPAEAPLSERIRRTEFIRNAPVIADEVAALEAKLALTEERLKRTISNCLSILRVVSSD